MEAMEIDEQQPSTSDFNERLNERNVEQGDTRKKKNRLEVCSDYNEFVALENAFRGILKTYFLKPNFDDVKDICLILTLNKAKMIDLIKNLLQEYGALKFNIVVECTYVKPLIGETEPRAFKTSNRTVFESSSHNEILLTLIRKICKEESEYQGKGSGWSLLSVDGIMLRFSRYRPLGGSSFLSLPKRIQTKNAVINPQNYNDNKCFQWSILAKHIEGKNVNRVNDRYSKLINKYDFSEIKFPTPLSDIKKFEKNNCDVSVNVYGLDSNDEVFPLRVCNEEKRNHFDLLLITNTQGVSHYCYIKNMSRLLCKQITKHTEKMVFCKRCLTHYLGPKKESKLKEHKKDCSVHKPLKVDMPCNAVDEDSPAVLKFSNFHNKFKVPIVIYSDFECILRKEEEKISKYTTVNETHEAMSFCVYVVYDSNSLSEDIVRNLPNEPYVYRGKDAPEKFIDYIISLTNLIGDLIDTYVPMLELTADELSRVNTAKHCEICDLKFTSLYPPVRDHCHLTGRFRSVLCNPCNLKRQNQKFIPVFLHGSSNYDTHFIVKQLGCDNFKIDVIANTNEKYISFAKQTSSGIKIRFIDSFKFLGASLSELTNNLPQNKFHHTHMFFTEDELPLVTRKGVYPYEYTDSWNKLEDAQLPNEESFFNKLTETSITEEDYNHAKEVWARFGFTNLGEYSDFYLRTDVLLLCDVFENFRNICIANYGLDPAYYLTIPSLTFDAMLKFTKVELELLNSYDKYLFVEKGIRGGISSCIKRYAKARNPQTDDCNEGEVNSYLTYIDANNLYGWAMCRPIPKDSFKWLRKKEIRDFNVLQVSNDSPVGYIIECDVAYPSYLHDYHNDLPFLPERKKCGNVKKLITSLENKSSYVCHYMNLKQAILNGLVLQKIHRILSFSQSTWLKKYIDFNTEKRKNATNDFEEDFYKLMNNSMFGKSMENIRNRRLIHLVNGEKRLNRLICKPSFKNRIVYSENLSAVELAKEKLIFNKPIYIGFTVLELSKYHMYNFHYNAMKNIYKSKINILYIDTDSFFYEIFTKDLYDDFKTEQLTDYLDMSDYPASHKCYNVSNKKRLGCFKDVCAGIAITEFVGLRPKLYTYKTMDDKFLTNVKKLALKKCKGVTKPVIKNRITFDDYKKCLFENCNVRENMRIFKSINHNVQTVTVNKLVLSCNDDKRHICSDGITTLAYGHCKILENVIE